jgi:hypothetical protein
LLLRREFRPAQGDIDFTCISGTIRDQVKAPAYAYPDTVYDGQG